MSSKGKAKTEQNADNETPRYNIGGVAFRLISENELTGERWDASAPAVRKLDTTDFKITACKWAELVDIAAAALVSCEGDMSLTDIKEHLATSKDLTVALLTLIVVNFMTSNGSWLGLLDARSQVNKMAMAEAIKEAMAEAKANGQLKSL